MGVAQEGMEVQEEAAFWMIVEQRFHKQKVFPEGFRMLSVFLE